MYKKTITSIIICFIFCCSAVAQECDTLDVFEEYAECTDSVCKTSPLSLTAAKNTTTSGKFNIQCDSEYKIEITTPPKKGRIKVLKDKISFEYTPYKNQTGADTFSYKINTSETSSNISQCCVEIEDNSEPSLSDTDFSYVDIKNEEIKNAAEKLVELNIIKGERIGNDYYFFPEAPITRASAICYLNAVADIDFSDSGTVNTDIFCDYAHLSEHIKNEINSAYISKIITGKNENGKLYINPHEYITRAEFFCMLDKAMSNKTNNQTEIKYIDKSTIPDYALICVKNLINANILTNSDNEKLSPNDILSKADIAVFLSRYIKYNENNTVKTISQRIKENFYGKIIA